MAPADASRLLGTLLGHALQPRFVYNHAWTLGDMVRWDNRSVLHKANYDFDPTDLTQHRCMYRMLFRGERPR
jgi:taurine dioxygenase